MADETIRITVNDESSKDKDDSIGQEIVSQADTGPQVPTDGAGQEPSKPLDTTDFEADVSSLDAVLEEYKAQQEKVLQDLIGTTESIAAAGSDVDGFSKSLNTAAEELDNLDVGEELAEGIDAINKAFGEVTAETEELKDGYTDLINAMSRSASEWNAVASELKNTTKIAEKAGLQTARQTANLARAAGLIGSNANQIVAAGTALAKGLTPAQRAAVAFTVAIAATVLAIKSLDKAAESLSKKIGGFSGETAVATAEKRILELEDRIRLGEERGSQAASFIKATSDLNSEVREFNRNVMGALLPLATFLTTILAAILQALNFILEPLIKIVDWITSIPGAIKDAVNAIIDKLGPLGAILDWLVASSPTPSGDTGINKDLIDLFDPHNVGFGGDKAGKAQEKAAQDRFDEMLNPPPAPP